MDEIDKYRKTQSKLTQEEIENLNRPIAKRLILTQFDSVWLLESKQFQFLKSPGSNGFTDNFYQMFKPLTLILSKSSRK